jgi:type IX secretion system PorP/SprF family membrane protein
MKKIFITYFTLFSSQYIIAQGLHFSQFYNAPTLINPSSYGLYPDADFRAGVNYRNQYSTIPVPYNTSSAFVDFTLRKNEERKDWFGVGISAFKDESGSGELSLLNLQAGLAYHIKTSDHTMWSLGTSVGNVSRTINLNKLSFIEQWDEFSFNNNLPSKENVTLGKTQYLDIGFGGSFSYFNEDKTYIQLGGGLSHLNRPKETFLGGSNRLGIRPNFTAEAIIKTSNNSILEPSLIYSNQKRASELVFGGKYRFNMRRGEAMYNLNGSSHLLLGTYYRWMDALIAVTGYKFNNSTFMLSYDVTMSRLAVANSRSGGIELSYIYSGPYRKIGGRSNIYGCPRF